MYTNSEQLNLVRLRSDITIAEDQAAKRSTITNPDRLRDRAATDGGGTGSSRRIEAGGTHPNRSLSMSSMGSGPSRSTSLKSMRREEKEIYYSITAEMILAQPCPTP